MCGRSVQGLGLVVLECQAVKRRKCDMEEGFWKEVSPKVMALLAPLQNRVSEVMSRNE
jgi:hypothetical protein